MREGAVSFAGPASCCPTHACRFRPGRETCPGLAFEGVRRKAFAVRFIQQDLIVIDDRTAGVEEHGEQTRSLFEFEYGVEWNGRTVGLFESRGRLNGDQPPSCSSNDANIHGRRRRMDGPDAFALRGAGNRALPPASAGPQRTTG